MRHARHIVLVGPMGAGKSHLGRLLALRMGRPFVDVDAAIEAAAGCTINALFDSEGEAGFRTREARVLGDLMAAALEVYGVLKVAGKDKGVDEARRELASRFARRKATAEPVGEAVVDA